jgi:hypothetical protein
MKLYLLQVWIYALWWTLGDLNIDTIYKNRYKHSLLLNWFQPYQIPMLKYADYVKNDTQICLYLISWLSDNIKSLDLADEKFVKNITLIKFFKRKFLLDFERILTVTAHVKKRLTPMIRQVETWMKLYLLQVWWIYTLRWTLGD